MCKGNALQNSLPTNTFQEKSKVMENLIATSIIVFVFYAWLFVPKKTTVTVIEDKNNISTKAVIVSETLSKSEFKKPSGIKKDKLTIRQLKKLASVAKIKGYSTKTKAELIACLC